MALFSFKKYEARIQEAVNQFNDALISIDDKVNKTYLDLKEIRRIQDTMREQIEMIRAMFSFFIVEMSRIDAGLTDEEYSRRVDLYVQLLKKHGFKIENKINPKPFGGND